MRNHCCLVPQEVIDRTTCIVEQALLKEILVAVKGEQLNFGKNSKSAHDRSSVPKCIV